MESDTTSHLRPSILTSFLRGSRPRSTATSPTGAEGPGINGSNVPTPINMGISNVSARRRAGAGGHSGPGTLPSAAGAGVAPATAGGQSLASQTPGQSLPIIMPAPTATSFSQMLRRRRSNNGNLNQAAASSSPANNPAPHSTVANNANVNVPPGTAPVVTGPAHRIRLVPHLENSRALHFDPITRECRENAPAIRIGRFTDRSGTLAASTNSLTGKIAFKSKVVSRGHAELWCEVNGRVHLSISQFSIDLLTPCAPQFFVKDTSSSSGTFLNHTRLSPAGVESRAHPLKDGDILQLGVDYQGGTEEIYRCVKIRVEIGREWQAGPNPFKYVHCPFSLL
jgi:E3 ubiquitin-protein ligase DMA1/2